MAVKEIVLYFLGSDVRVPKKALEDVSKINNFVDVYQAFSCGVLPSDGYVAVFNAKNETEITDIDRELAKIKGIRPRTIFSGMMLGQKVKGPKKK